MSVPRIEAIGSLLAAMAVVALTGNMPDFLPAAESCPQFDVLAKPKLIVPLARRYSGLFRYARNGVFRGHRLPFRPALLLEERFGLRWVGAQVDGILGGQVMPSTIQIEIARHMAKGDSEMMSRLLVSRATKGIREADASVSRRFRVSGAYTTALWRFAGNADELWYVMRDEMEQAVRSISGGAL